MGGSDPSDSRSSESVEEGRRPGARRGVIAVLFVALCVAPIVGRVAMEARAELSLADEAARAGDLDGEVIHLGRAARWRLSGLPYHQRAIDKLMALAAAHEAAEEDETSRALACLREVRRALISTRHVTIPSPELLDEVNGRIATLMARQEYQLGMNTGTEAEVRAWHIERLESGPAPSRAWVAAVASWSFVGWVLAAIGFLLWGIDARGRLRGKQAVRWGAAFMVLLVTWMVCTAFAV